MKCRETGKRFTWLEPVVVGHSGRLGWECQRSWHSSRSPGLYHAWSTVDGYLLFQERMTAWHWNHKRFKLEAQFWKHNKYFPFEIKINHMEIRALQIQLSWYCVGKLFGVMVLNQIN
ncbi:hypothetical protein BD769DRAFT_1385168 [Suillus cothurnatus]|nr:hypothetical protein BD769DRAFT_1385168 [Suillus cothurnatus]